MLKIRVSLYMILMFGISFLPLPEAFSANKRDKSELNEAMKRGEMLITQYCQSEVDDPRSKEYSLCTEGIGIIETVLSHDPSNRAALRLLLEGYRNRSREKGIDIAKALIKIDPKSGDAYLYLGLKSEKPAEKIAYLRKASELSPDNIWVHGELAWNLARNRVNASEATDEIIKHIKANPDSSDVIYRVADELWTQGYRTEVKNIYITYLKASKLEKRVCEKFIHDALQKFIDQTEVINVFKEECRGTAYFELSKREKNLKKRIYLLEKAVAETPDHPKAHGELAESLLHSRKDIARSIEEMKKQMRFHSIDLNQQVLSFGQLLGQQGFRDEEVEIYGFYLRSDVSPEKKCKFVGLLNIESYKEYQNFIDLIHKTCK